MPNLVDKHLVKAVIDLAAFLEFASEEDLDEDASIQAMEQLASELGQMSEGSKQAFVDIAHRLAPDYGEREGFVNGLAASFGLKG